MTYNVQESHLANLPGFVLWSFDGAASIIVGFFRLKDDAEFARKCFTQRAGTIEILPRFYVERGD